MILTLTSGKQIRSDLVKSSVIRSDLSPIPLTLEAEIRTDADMTKQLAEGKIITIGDFEKMTIVKSVTVVEREVQGEREISFIRITAMLDACHTVAFVRTRAIIKENAALSAIYRAAGATIKAVDADFPVPRFYCPIGDTPSYHISRVLQEEGGVVRWRNSKLNFFRLPDLFKQKPVTKLPNNASDDVESGFLERHEIPWFFSLKDNAAFEYGNQTKPRSVRFSPFKNVQRLRNMSRCLVQRKVMRTDYSAQIVAGDLIEFVGGPDLVVITAAHVFESGTDGGETNQYSRLWLGTLEG